MSAFDDATRFTAVEPGRYAGELSGLYNIGPVPNGGYVAALGLAALEAALPGREPLAVTTHYLRPARVGPVEARVEVLKEGKRFATAVARLRQEGQEHAIVLATFGVLDGAREPVRHIAAAPPPLPPPAECVQAPRPDVFAITHQFDTLIDPSAGFLVGRPTGRAEVSGWLRFRDGRAPDLRALLLFSDGMPPALFNVQRTGWVPTIELTVHLRARPAPGWLRAVFTSRFVFGGFLEEDGELWDERGVLVAQSRQLAQVPNLG